MGVAATVDGLGAFPGMPHFLLTTYRFDIARRGGGDVTTADVECLSKVVPGGRGATVGTVLTVI